MVRWLHVPDTSHGHQIARLQDCKSVRLQDCKIVRYA